MPILLTLRTKLTLQRNTDLSIRIFIPLFFKFVVVYLGGGILELISLRPQNKAREKKDVTEESHVLVSIPFI